MKKSYLLLFTAVFALSVACNTETKDSEVESQDTESNVSAVIPGNYGADVSDKEIISTAEMISLVENEGEFTGKISGEIKEVCTKKGCWLTMDLPNGESMRVTFKDYGFFVPTTSSGYPVILEGVAILTETDVETLRHYAEDGGMSAQEVAEITEPKREITFEAVGAMIKDKA